ncbi:GUN4 domain-containing protein, partial [Nodularia spumigena CS-590/02]
VSRILPHIIPSIQLPEGTEVYSLYQKAHDKLHQLWGNKDNKSEEKWREIFRLKFANRENSERFRQGFSQMLDVQYNSEAGQAYESELRKVADDLVEDRLCSLLENYLKQKQWKQADEETAWIFYQVMVKENYEDWEYLLHNFPCEILKEINQLWLQNSNNKFGISIQMEIYRSLGGTEKYDSNVWNEFCDLVPSRDHKRERVHREGSMVSECQRGAYPAKIFDNYLGFEKGRGFGEGQWWWFGLKDSSET